ncbi:MAG: Fpg/Nei family DNA glycosylase [Chloroflexi bacterium]|nr:Fpg/Nei family DNA glycosylase [Chloroflexota bacterium]
MAFELPEALTVARQMEAVLPGLTIQSVTLSPACDHLIRQGFINLDQIDLAGSTISGVAGRGKWIFTHLDTDVYFLIALETGGKVLYHPSGSPVPPKFHLRFDFTGGSSLTVFILGWGFAKAVPAVQLEQTRYPGRLGVSPLDPLEFTPQRLGEMLAAGGMKNCKGVLLDQWQLAGIGNGYLQDILYTAGIHPKRKTPSLSKEETGRLYGAIQAVLSEAVRLNGSRQECDLYGAPGGYARLMGEGMNGKPCPKCGTPIEKIGVQGSSCTICPSCQK